MIVTANWTARTREDATVHVCDLDMCVEVQLLKEPPAVLTLGTLCEENGNSYEWHPTSHSEWEKHRVHKPTTRFLLVVPSVQAITRPKLWTTGRRHERATMSYECKQNYQTGFNHSRKEGSSSSTDVSPADVNIPQPAIPPFAHLPATLTINEAGGNHKETQAKCGDARKLRERHAEEILIVGRQT